MSSSFLQRRNALPLIAVAVTVSLAGTTAAHAADDAVIDEVIITARYIASTIGKSEAPLIETPFTIDVLDHQVMEQRGVESVAEALRYVPGVTTEARGGGITRYDLYNVRGFDNGFGSSYFDGMKLYHGGWWLALQVDASVAERIEILKGPASVLYGNTPPGGLINVVSKRPSNDAATSFGLSLGNRDSRELSFDSTGAIGDTDLSYRLVGVARERDGQAVTTREERYVLAPSVRRDFTPDTALTLTGYYQDDPETGHYGATSPFGSLVSNPNGKLPTDFYDGDVNFESGHKRQRALGYTFEHRFSDDWSLIQNLRYMEGDLLYESIYPNNTDLTDFRTSNRAAIYSDERIDATTLDTRLYGTFEIGRTAHTMLFGVDYQDFSLDGEWGFGSAPPLDLFAPDNSQIDRDALRASLARFPLNAEENQLGFYAQDQLKLGGLVLLAGARYDNYESKSGDFDQDNLGVRAGALYHFDSGLAPYVSYTESFEGQGGADFGGNPFEPIEGQQIELGVKYELPGGRALLTLAAYEITRENILSTDPAHPLFSVQGGEQRTRGIELEGNARLTEALEVRFGFSTLDPEYTRGDNVGDHVKGVADQTASLWALYSFNGTLEGLTVGGGAHYTGKSYAADDLDLFGDGHPFDVRVPAYTLFDLTASYTTTIASTPLRFGLTANNVADKRHVTSCYLTDFTHWCWFGAERTVEASVQARF
jgi:iron complex outermembrane receptor protein